MDDNKEYSGLTGARCLLLVACVVLGAFVAWGASPALFRALPTDMTRISVLLDALDKGDTSPRIVLFGSSVGMASVDMGLVSQYLVGSPAAWNMASTGQTPIESYLYYQELPEDVDLIIQFFNPSTLTNWDILDFQKYNAFYMNGYRANNITQERLASILGEDMKALLDTPDIEQRFASRWALRQVADHYARGLLRQDLTLDQGTYDLLYPSSYTTRISDAAMKREIDRRFGGAVDPVEFYPKPTKLEMLAELKRRAAEEGKGFIFVMQPQHPSQHQYRHENYFRDAFQVLGELAAREGAILLDATDVIPEQHFVDSAHPSPEGAVIFSRWLAKQLNQLKESDQISY